MYPIRIEYTYGFYGYETIIAYNHSELGAAINKLIQKNASVIGIRSVD